MSFEDRTREYAAALGIEIEPLLTPISEEKPSGEWLRYEPLYLQVQTARRADDESLPQGIWKTAPKRADHAEVIRLCQRALREQSKDVQLAAWLCEAWARLHGPRGLCVGLLVLKELCARFWESLYPVLDEGGDASYRLAPIEALDRALALVLKLLPLNQPSPGQPSLGQERILTYADWERAQRSRSGAEGQADELTAAGFLGYLAQSPERSLRALRSQLTDVQHGAERLEGQIDQKMHDPSGSASRDAGAVMLRELRGAVGALLAVLAQLGHEPDSAPEPAPMSAPETPSGLASSAAPAGSRAAEPQAPARGPIRSRAEAYLRLSEAAEYLLLTEPHSPVPYLVRRAVSWGGMSLAQLLDELVQEDSDRRAIFALLAMREPRGE